MTIQDVARKAKVSVKTVSRAMNRHEHISPKTREKVERAMQVTCLERGLYFHRWDYLTKPRKQGGKAFVELRHDGTAPFHEGYISQAEARRQETARQGKAGQGAGPVKPEMSGPLSEYIPLHRHRASRRDETRASLEASKAAAELEAKRGRIASLFEALEVFRA